MPHFDILGVPIGNYLFCANFIASKGMKLRSCYLNLKILPASRDPQVALTLMRMCGGFCRFNHLARAIPTPLAFDVDVRQC